MSASSEPRSSDARAWLACALIVAAAIVLVVGLLLLDGPPDARLALVVGPAAALVALAAFLAP